MRSGWCLWKAGGRPEPWEDQEQYQRLESYGDHPSKDRTEPSRVHGQNLVTRGEGLQGKTQGSLRGLDSIRQLTVMASTQR